MKNDHANHMWWMALACAIPLIIVSILPAIGIKSNYTGVLLIVLVVGAHLLMIGKSCHHDDKKGEKKDGDHEHH